MAIRRIIRVVGAIISILSTFIIISINLCQSPNI